MQPYYVRQADLWRIGFHVKHKYFPLCILHALPDDGPSWPKHVEEILHIRLFTITVLLFTAQLHTQLLRDYATIHEGNDCHISWICSL